MSIWFCWRWPPDTSLHHCPLVVQIIQNVLFDPIVIYMVHKPIEECTTDTALSLFFTFNHPASKDVLCLLQLAQGRPILILCMTSSLHKLSKNNFLFTIAFASHIYMGQVTELRLFCYRFCYQLIAKPGNKTAAVPWLDPYNVATKKIDIYEEYIDHVSVECDFLCQHRHSRSGIM